MPRKKERKHRPKPPESQLSQHLAEERARRAEQLKPQLPQHVAEEATQRGYYENLRAQAAQMISSWATANYRPSKKMRQKTNQGEKS